ncbi:LAMI_0C10770g1_1 [Lachancea mirantina]|uniref:Biogenesis of lysosome-related organelles complex 1 subunit BLI1 n=1 Tax=Lachancea mirantina TaxID=1230905 RepID=A0A1G4J6F1_9SACH|nr:LAMI_0C10770g1_1 [Lachancea mirantina]
MNEKALKKELEACIVQLQEIANVESAEAISGFEGTIERNYKKLEELKTKFILKNGDEDRDRAMDVLDQFDEKLSALETVVEYHEKLADEIDEVLREFKVKKELAENRLSRGRIV